MTESKEVVSWIIKKEEILQVYPYVRTYQLVYFKLVQFIVCNYSSLKLSLKALIRKEGPLGFSRAVCYPSELCAVMKCIFLLSSTVDDSHMLVLSICNVTNVTKKLNFKLYLN